MQIRLTVLGSRSGHQAATAPAGCDVLVTAPAGTALAAVASGLAATVGGPDTGGTVVLYAGSRRLDPQRAVLGEPPLIDGAVLALHTPGPDAAALPDEGPGTPQLHVVAGPDAGGVHLLHTGAVRIGRSADADVPLDDPDVSRLHCAVTVMPDGRVTVADLGSTNGTTLDGAEVGARPVPLAPGALLRIGESTLRLAAAGGEPQLAVVPDQEGHLSLPVASGGGTGPGGASGGTRPGAGASGSGTAPGAGASGSGTAPGAGAGLRAEGSGPQESFPHPAPSRSTDVRLRRVGGSAPDPVTGPRPGTPEPGTPGTDHGPAEPAYADGDAGADPGAPLAGGARRRRGGIGAWARKWVRGEEEAPEQPAEPEAVAPAAPDEDDPAALLLAALGPTGRLWSRGPGHPGFLEAGLGAGSRVALPECGSLGVAGPRARLTGVARSVVAQLVGLHSAAQLEVVLLAADRARPVPERRRDWGWLGWLPHVRPAHGQDCRLLLAYDRDQAAARAGELTRRLDDSPLGTNWASAGPAALRQAAAAYEGPRTLVILDGDPGSAALRDLTGRLASHGAAAGIHLLVLSEAPAATPASPVAATYETACASTPAFRECGRVALLSGDVATAVRSFAVSGGRPVATGRTAVADAVSAAWAERFARALAPLRADGAAPGEGAYRPAAASLPAASRLLDELGLARATPASLMARWAEATDEGQGVGGLAEVVLGAGRRGAVGAELVHDGPHLLVEGPAGSGRTELLRSVAASLAAAARPDRLGLVLLDGAGGERGDGLLPCTELPHVSAHLVASDPLRMREFAQALGAELKRRHELLDGVAFTEWHARRELSDRMVSPRQPSAGELRGDLDPQRTGTLRLRASATRTEAAAGPSPLPRLVVLVDDFDALVAPALGSPGRPAAGSVVRVLEAVAREGARLGVHLVVASASPERTAETEPARLATLRVVLDAPDQPGPGRGRLLYADGRAVPFQAGRVTGRIPRTATLRPTVVPVEWERMGDPPARRPVRELGNGPTDLALLASALDRASHLVSAIPVLFPPAP
ncbi:FHA domain-containing protein [Streptomyces sp. NBC_00091]|uniref:FHA domain-containing protein n=1 Tax=Streptomyces sp. NBC_00091 TaxID=2975648 RepID=UPI00224FE659|nr:FHA domain-containing protein [Streptomyces sp. NBC_00091]MCX5378081.1 FHA domain-containing protein [Streptomyces sp. NBC_00091]